MGQASDNTAAAAALSMLDTFGSVGAETFDTTWTNAHGEKVNFRRGVRLDTLRRSIPAQLAEATSLQQNIIIRPHGQGVTFVQLDDLDEAGIHSATPAAFLTLETSPGNYQAWLALAGKQSAGSQAFAPSLGDEDLARRIRKGVAADPSASGATRIAGSLNFKDKYAPNFPRVRIASSSPGLITTPEQLETLSLLASPLPTRPATVRVSPRSGATTRGGATRGAAWPSYERCVKGAPFAHGSDQGHARPDISRADFTWCLLAIDWGRGVEETAARLMEVSSKAQENGETYAQLTAQHAAEAVTRNRSR